MLRTNTQETTKRTSLRRISGIDVFNDNPNDLSLVLDKSLQLSESPTMQTGSNSFATFDGFSDVGQVFKYNFTRSERFGFLNNRFAHFVIHVSNSSLLFARDPSESLLSTLTAVGLQTTTKRKMFVPSMSEFFTTKYLPRTRSGKVVSSDIDTHNGFGFNLGSFWKLKNKIEKPASFAKNQLGFLGNSAFEQRRLVLSANPFHFDSATESVKGKSVRLDGVGSLIKMDVRFAKVDDGNGIFLDLPQGFLRFVGFADGKDSVASHLGAQRSFLPQMALLTKWRGGLDSGERSV